jgi:hypothetical protein
VELLENDKLSLTFSKEFVKLLNYSLSVPHFSGVSGVGGKIGKAKKI